MSLSTEVRRCLDVCDVAGLRRAWRETAPHLPQPATDGQAEIMLHHARTAANSIALPKRVYSHSWLTERGLPSALPDELRPRGERVHPVIVEAVGIAVKASSDASRPLAVAIHDGMRNAVLEMQADGVKDPQLIRAEMMRARDKIKAMN